MSQGQNTRSAGHHFLCGVRRIQPTLLCVWKLKQELLNLGILSGYSASVHNVCTVNLAELKNVWSYTSAPPYVVTSRYLINHTVNCTFCTALERIQRQIWGTKRQEQLMYCETPCDYHLSPVDNLSEGWRVSFGRGNTTTTLRSTV